MAFASSSPRRWTLAAVLAGCAAFVSAAAPAQQFLGSNDSSWHKYVRAPPSHSVQPARILTQYTAGNVSNANGLVGGGSGGTGGPMILTRLSSGQDVPTVVVDFGQNVAGLLTIAFAGSYNTSQGLPGITLAFSETLQFLTDRSDFTRSDNAGGSEKLTSGTDQIAVRPGPYTWVDQLGCEYGNQVCADGLHGFRYVKIRLAALPGDAPYTSALGSVAISSVSLQYSGLLGTPDTFTGHFECSDPNITQWWYDAVYTNDLCTDVFLANDTEPRGAASPTLLGKLVLHDGPKRDRDPYVGDLAVSALTSYLSHDVHAAARNVLEDLIIHQRDDGWIPPASINDYTLPLFDYPLWWVVCSGDYVMYTGNVSFLQAYYPALVKTLDGYYPGQTNASTGLIERPDGMGDFAFLPRTGAVTYYNALYVRALNYAAELAGVLGKSDDAARWRARAAAVGPALVKRNWDAGVGAFFDGGPCGSAAICDTHAQDGNSLAILAGVVSSGASNASAAGNASLAESILSYLAGATARPYGNAFYDNTALGGDFADRVYAFISYFELAARFSVSPATVPGAFEELRRLYGWMATNDPTVTLWEGIGAGGSPYEGGFTSMSHGWSTGIVPLMVNYVLGVNPTAPGFAQWSIRPVGIASSGDGELTWASGLVPTPGGGIQVQWETKAAGADGEFSMSISAPANTKGIVAVPVSSGSVSVSADGKVVYDGTRNFVASGVQYEGGYVLVSVGGGEHDFSVG